MNKRFLKLISLLLLLPFPTKAETGATVTANRGDKISLSYFEPMTRTHDVAILRPDGSLKFTVSIALNEKGDFKLLSSHSTQLNSDTFKKALRMLSHAQFSLMPELLKPLAGKDCWSDPVKMTVSLSLNNTVRTVSYWQSCTGAQGQPAFEGLVKEIDMMLGFSDWLLKDLDARSVEADRNLD